MTKRRTTRTRARARMSTAWVPLTKAYIETPEEVEALRRRIVGGARLARPNGRLQAVEDLAYTANIRHARLGVALRDVAQALLRQNTMRREIEALERRVASKESVFRALTEEAFAPVDPDDETPARHAERLTDGVPGSWFGFDPVWIDPGQTMVISMQPIIPVFATHLAVAPGSVDRMRISSIKAGCQELCVARSLPAAVFAVRFREAEPDRAAGERATHRPIDRGGRLAREPMRLYPAVPMLVAVSNGRDSRALFECALFGGLLELPDGRPNPDSLGPRGRSSLD